MANTKITSRVIANDAITSDLIADDVALGGNPTTSTQTAGNSTTRIATTAFVSTAVANIVDSAPATLDTLGEIATALNNDAALNTTLTNSIATKLPLAGGTMTGDLILGDSVKAQFGTGNDLRIYHDGSSSHIENHLSNLTLTNYADDSDIIFRSDDGSGGHTSYITIDGSAGLTQFDKHTKHTDNIKAYFGNSSDLQIYHDGSHSTIKEDGTGDLRIDGDSVYIRESDGTNQISAASGTATLYKDGTARLATTSSGVTVTGTLTASGITVDELTIDADTITATDDFIIDATTNIFLDADGGEIVLRDGGSNFGYFHQDSDNFEIISTRSNGDIIFKGNDGGSTITALTLDMSDAGTATFNHDVKLGDDSELVLGDNTDLKFYHSGSVNYIKTNSDLPLKIWDAGGAGILEMTPNGKVGIFHNGSEKIYTTSTGAVIAHNSDTDYSSTGEPAGILTLYNSNGSDGGGVNNYSSLEFNTGDGATSQGFINYVRTADNQGKFTFSQRTGSSTYAEAVVIDNSGNIDVAGIVDGTNFKINGAQGSDGQVLTSTGSGVAWEDAAGGSADGITASGSYTIIQSPDDTSVVAVGNNANVGIGTLTPGQKLTVEGSSPQIEFRNTASSAAYFTFVNSSATTSYNDIASIGGEIDSGNAKGRLVFRARRTDASSSQQEVMRINNTGGVTMKSSHQGDTIGNLLVTSQVPSSPNASENCQISVKNGGQMVQIMAWAGLGARVGTRTSGWDSNSGGNCYLTGQDATCLVLKSDGVAYLANGSTAVTSDERLKKNITDMADGQLAKINALKVRHFEWKDGRKTGTQTGVIAQEVEIVEAALVTETEIAPDPDDTSRDFDGDVKIVKYGDINMRLLKAVQELSAKLDAAEARIATLEG